MSRLLPLLRHRLYSTTTNPPSPHDAKTAAALFLAAHTSSPPQVRTQTLDYNQLHLLSSTLSRPPPSPPGPPTTNTTTTTDVNTIGTVIPPCHHLIYFTPSQAPELLGPDGTDTTYNPPAPFTRRMWAGGEVVWPRRKKTGARTGTAARQREEEGGKGGGRVNLLRVGQTVTETTTVRSAEGKRTRGGEEMVVVGVEKVFENEDGVAVIDRRNWIFRPSLHISSSSSTSTTPTTTTQHPHPTAEKSALPSLLPYSPSEFPAPSSFPSSPSSLPSFPSSSSSSSPSESFSDPSSGSLSSSSSSSPDNPDTTPSPSSQSQSYTSSPYPTPSSQYQPPSSSSGSDSGYSGTTTTTPTPTTDTHILTLTTPPTTLFRFSALTFNAHKIHLDREWCRRVEGHRDLVVHGPLNLVRMVDFWRDVIVGSGSGSSSSSSSSSSSTGASGVGGGEPGTRNGNGNGNGNGSEMTPGQEEEEEEEDLVVPARVVYRATGPFYADERCRIEMDGERDGVSEVRIVDGEGNVGMVGRIERYLGA